jgi:hypothetical protein
MTIPRSKPVLTLIVAIVGHRLDRSSTLGATPGLAFDVEEVRASTDHALAAISKIARELLQQRPECFASQSPLISVVTSLGEGADRIGAESAIASGLPFDVILPFSREVYEQTFADQASRAEFRTLLAKARAMMVLPATSALQDEEQRARAYEQAGLALLARADILIAVWDGKPALGRGGTADTVANAARRGTPVVAIEPSGRRRLLWRGDLESSPLALQEPNLTERVDFDDGLRNAISSLVLPAGKRG